MWVQFNKTYAGPLGMFIVGSKQNLPEEAISEIRKAIGKENVVDTVAPWEEHVNHKVAAKSEAVEKARAAIADVERKKAEMVELRKVAARINVLKKEIEDGTEKAKRFAKAAGIEFKPADSGVAAKEDAGNIKR